MSGHILQVGYYPTLNETRVEILHKAGYRVMSVLGNDSAMALDKSAFASIDLVVVGASAPQSTRAEMLGWLKTHYPNIPVLMLQYREWETFSGADAAVPADNPMLWLQVVAGLLGS